MTTFLLIHGGGLGGWSWDRCRHLFGRAGHRVVAPDLLLDRCGLRDVAAQAAGALGPAGDVVVVGHALGCTPLPLIASLVGARAMVFVCGIIPQAGRSSADQINDDPSIVPMYDGRGFAEASASQGSDPFREALLHDCDIATRRWAEDRMPASAASRRRGPVNAATDRFPPDPWPEIPVGFVLGTDDRAVSPAWARRAARERLGVEAVELPGGHCPNIARPEVLVPAVLAIAGG